MEHSIPKINREGGVNDDARVRRNRIGLRQALLTLLETARFEEITVRQIAATAGVGYTTYFRHFPGKEALLEDVIAEEIVHLVALIRPVYDSAGRRQACDALCRYVDENRALWSVLLTGGAANVVRDELIRQGRELTTRRPNPKDWLPDGLGVVLSMSSMVELLKWWLMAPSPLSVDQISGILDRVSIAPVEIDGSIQPE